jgi:hypothetical protein
VKLRAKDAYWDPANLVIKDLLDVDSKDMTKEQLVLIVHELDRRFIQLWDKISFEKRLKN